MSRKKLGVATAGVLAATIAVEDEARGWHPAVPGHLQRAAGQLRVDRRTHRPAHVRRLNRSSTTARYSQPSPVEM